MKLYLCGMIGSGKTTLGKRLAGVFDLPFYDLDQEMDRRLGHSFHQLVAEKGWLAFRELEYSICKMFAARDAGVVCLGGGTVRYEWNRDLLKGTGPIILLEASLEALAERVRVADRPRVNPDVDLEEDLRIMWTTAKDKYRAAADLVFDTTGKSEARCVSALTRMIRNHFSKR